MKNFNFCLILAYTINPIYMFGNCVAKVSPKAIRGGMTLSESSVYASIEGYIRTNGKKFKQNLFF
tara:strand:- start:432 stop:626 length:195 start_codon:yes stop_codon:yes gene_type:complete